MQLTPSQIQALDAGSAVVVDVEDRECVVLRRDMYDRLMQAVQFDEMTPERAYPAILAAWDQDEDPGLSAYQGYQRSTRSIMAPH